MWVKKSISLLISNLVDKGASPSFHCHDDQDDEGPSKSKRDKPSILYQPPAVPIHKGDLIEFLVGDRTWFLVEVTGRGKIGGKNQNYLNVKYSDGSEGGVFIDQHEWRIVKRKDITMEDSPPPSETIPINYRLHRVTVDIPSSCEEMSTATEVDTTTDDENTAGDEADSEMQKSVKVSRKRKRRRKRRDRVRKISVDESVFDPSNSIKKGDIIEYIVKEEDGKGEDLTFQVEVLSKGKSSGRNKNYLNIRYSDGSVGGVFINKHQWRIVAKLEEKKS